MAKSRKLPIYRSYGYNRCKEIYRRCIRRSIKNYLRSCKTLDDMNACPQRNEIITMYDWIDWKFDHRPGSCGITSKGNCRLWNKTLGYDETRINVCEECRKKYSRK